MPPNDAAVGVGILKKLYLGERPRQAAVERVITQPGTGDRLATRINHPNPQRPAEAQCQLHGRQVGLQVEGENSGGEAGRIRGHKLGPRPAACDSKCAVRCRMGIPAAGLGKPAHMNQRPGHRLLRRVHDGALDDDARAESEREGAFEQLPGEFRAGAHINGFGS